MALIISILIAEAAGIIGSVFTTSAIGTWYQTLNKPSFNPPNWLFGPVWITLYALMGIAAWLVWKTKKTKKRKTALKFYAAQLVANSLWSILFFGLKNPLLALIEIGVLWVLILITTKKFYQLNKTAGALMFPYLAWVSFATILNFAIVSLN